MRFLKRIYHKIFAAWYKWRARKVRNKTNNLLQLGVDDNLCEIIDRMPLRIQVGLYRTLLEQSAAKLGSKSKEL